MWYIQTQRDQQPPAAQQIRRRRVVLRMKTDQRDHWTQMKRQLRDKSNVTEILSKVKVSHTKKNINHYRHCATLCIHLNSQVGACGFR